MGASGGPVLLSALLAWVPLAVGCLVVGVLGLAGAGWTGLRTARVDAARRGASR